MVLPVPSTSIPTQQRLLFVVGFFRSGTTLIYSLLNLHPQIKLLYEADLLSNPLVAVSGWTRRDWVQRLDFYNSCIRRHGIEPPPDWNRSLSAAEAAELLYRHYGGPVPLYVGEKSPSYYNCLPDLARKFPQARFIVIWRNPLDVVSSIVSASEKNDFFGNHSLPLRSVLGLEQMQKDTVALRATGTPIFDFCYEDLVEEPEAVLRAICKFLELPFDPRMLDLEKVDCSMLPPGEHHAKARSRRLVKEPRPRPGTLNGIEQKIHRYLFRWQALFQDRLATRRYWPKGPGRPPGLMEILSDYGSYRLACVFSEQWIPVIYGILPRSWLLSYRNWSRQIHPRPTGRISEPATVATKISVVTPSYKQLSWLKLCIASIADQTGVSVEHIIQDAQSGPDLETWVHKNSKSQIFVEADSGMYDAIERGFARSTGDIVCWLNSDEQYLEGTLAKVARYFALHPEIDVLFGDALLIANTGKLLSYRRTILPELRHIQLSHLNILSCATFVRRSVIERGFKLDLRWKAITDAVWIADLLKARVPMAILEEPLSVFTITDSNLGQTSLAFAENIRWQKEISRGTSWQRPFIVLWHRWSKFIHGAYWPRAIHCRIYTLDSPKERVVVRASFLGFTWPN